MTQGSSHFLNTPHNLFPGYGNELTLSEEGVYRTFSLDLSCNCEICFHPQQCTINLCLLQFWSRTFGSDLTLFVLHKRLNPELKCEANVKVAKTGVP